MKQVKEKLQNLFKLALSKEDESSIIDTDASDECWGRILKCRDIEKKAKDL